MNYTFLHFTLKNIAKYDSPLFSGKFTSNMNLGKSSFSYFSKPIIDSFSFRKISESTFRKGLSAAVSINSEAISGQTYKTNGIIKPDNWIGDLEISKCSFEDITSGVNQSAVYIFYTYKLKSTLKVTDCSFTNCYSSTAGAIAACINSASVSRTCIYHCFGSAFAAISMQTKSGSDLSVTYSTLQQSRRFDEANYPRSALSLDGGILKFQNNNVSSNTINFKEDSSFSIVELWTRGSIECKDSTFESNRLVSPLAVLSISPFKDISRLNFYNNSARYPYGLISFSYEVVIKNSIMKLNNIDTFWRIIIPSDQDEQESYCLYFVDCQIDLDAPETTIYFSADANQFNKEPSTIELDLLNSGLCKGNQLTNNYDDDDGLGVAAIIGIFLICFLISFAIVFFIAYKKNDQLQRLFIRCSKREKLPDYEVGLADIQVDRE